MQAFDSLVGTAPHPRKNSMEEPNMTGASSRFSDTVRPGTT